MGKGILVTGDFVVDRHTYRGLRVHFSDDEPGVTSVDELGGAALVQRLLERLAHERQALHDRRVEQAAAALERAHASLRAAAGNDDERARAERLVDVRRQVEIQAREHRDALEGWAPRLGVSLAPPARDLKGLGDEHRAYAFWEPRPNFDRKNGLRPGKERYWRVADGGRLGFGKAPRTPAPSPFTHRRGLDPRIVVISEGGRDFRHRDDFEQLISPDADWIVLKPCAPVADPRDPLWAHLATRDDLRRKLVVVVSASELRKSDAVLSSGLSWDHTLRQLRREFLRERDVDPDEDSVVRVPEGAFAPLLAARHVLIAFGSEGGLWIDSEAGEATFVYESELIEGALDHEHQGTTFGFMSCMAAAVGWHCALELERPSPNRRPDFVRAIEWALEAMRDLETKGHGDVDTTDEALGFPAERIARAMTSPPLRLSRATFPLESRPPAPRSELDALLPYDDWSLVADAVATAEGSAGRPAIELAKLVVQRGHIALSNVPHLKIGALVSVDPEEIANLRTLLQLMRRYADDDTVTRPLSIGVFGQPGSGKSFSVKQIARNSIPGVEWLEYNLSQFSSPSDLVGAFHQIRDQVLQKKLPVAFFDEFDSQQLVWLQSLLAPMQDGQFQSDRLTHTIGKCIFVCAGGTSWTFGAFGPPGLAPGQEPGDDFRARRLADFALAKGPDFKSRLDAYLDVAGPNQRLRPVGEPSRSAPEARRWSGGHAFEPDPTDIFFPVRRALILRHKLQASDHALVDLDDGVLDALLHVEHFAHGSRSLEKVIDRFTDARGRAMTPSMLPPTQQLRMHLGDDATFRQAFLRARARPADTATATDADADADIRDDEELVERIAVRIHEAYLELGRRQGWLAPEKDLPFGDLDLTEGPAWLGAFYQESNREAARRMIGNLALVGLRLVRRQAGAPADPAVARHIDAHLEVMADYEHREWVAWHHAQGWRYGKQKDEVNRRHPCLRPFADLSEQDREKDRSSVRCYADHAAEVGYVIDFRNRARRMRRADEV